MSAGSEPLVRACGLGKRYGDIEALRDVSLHVLPGEVLGLLGPNGAGKSTAIGLILGLQLPTRGEVQLFQGSPADLVTRRRVGYLPESPTFPEYHSPWTLLQFHAALLEIEPGDRGDRASAALAAAGLTAATHQAVPTLSKGTLQRLGLAVALLGDPELLVLDEPSSHLDPVGRHDLAEIVRARRDRGRTVILSSHVLAEIEATCDRVVILRAGAVVLEGSLMELCHAPGCSLEQVFLQAMGQRLGDAW